MKRFSVILALGALTGSALAACGDEQPQGCTPGYMGCECDAATSCVPGLACEQNKCVMPFPDSDTDSLGTESSDGTGGGSGAGSTGSAVPSAPQIISFTTSVGSIVDGGFVTFSAELADANGLTDIVSAVLTSADMAVTYGELTDMGMGVFSLGLSWDDINLVAPLNFKNNEQRSFALTVTDTTDMTASDTVELVFSCVALDACNGVCTDVLSTDAHCGACGDACPMVDGIGGCDAGSCEPTLSDCVEPQDVTTCEQYCAAQGETCVEDGCGTATYILYTSQQMCTDGTAAVAQGTPCTTPVNFALGPGYELARCCCTVG